MNTTPEVKGALKDAVADSESKAKEAALKAAA